MCFLGNKHSDPRIENAIEGLAAEGVHGLVGLVLAPHYSRGSVGEYVARARQRADELGVPAAFVESWHEHPVLVELLAERVGDALGSLGPDGAAARENGRASPARHRAQPPVAGRGRRRSLRRPAPAYRRTGGVSVGARALGHRLAERRPDAGTLARADILERLRSLPAEGVDAVVVCPAGFTSDHLEILYDLDIDASRVAAEAGVAFARTQSLNADPTDVRRVGRARHRPGGGGSRAVNRVVAVVGGGISGLAAARVLAGACPSAVNCRNGPGQRTPDRDTEVVLLESDDRFGGKILSGEFRGRPVDFGPDNS